MKEFGNIRLKRRLTGAIGLTRGDNYILDLSFDILSLEALFLVPRYASMNLWSPVCPTSSNTDIGFARL